MLGAGVPHRVVVTGLGVVTPIGTTVPDFWAGCKRAQLGISPLDGFDLADLKILIGAQIRDFDPKVRLKHFQRDKIILRADRYCWFAAGAADEALKQSACRMILSRWKCFRRTLGSKSRIWAPIRILRSARSNPSSGLMPSWLRLQPAQNSGTVVPIGVTTPTPVTTTRCGTPAPCICTSSRPVGAYGGAW